MDTLKPTEVHASGPQGHVCVGTGRPVGRGSPQAASARVLGGLGVTSLCTRSSLLRVRPCSEDFLPGAFQKPSCRSHQIRGPHMSLFSLVNSRHFGEPRDTVPRAGTPGLPLSLHCLSLVPHVLPLQERTCQNTGPGSF